MAVFRLENSIRKYSWGDPDLIPAFLGVENPLREPWAELWLGAHHKAPSMARQPDGSLTSLEDLILEAPEAMLGPAGAADPRLPFLFKLMAVAKPLSLQAHPSAQAATRGFKREERAALPLEAAERNYSDGRHKPELVVALDRFEGLCGFRPIDEIIRNLKLLAGENWRSYAERLSLHPGRLELAVVFYSFCTAPEAERTRLFKLVRPRIDRILAEAKPGSPAQRTLGWVPRLMELYPNDMAALAPIMMNTFDLGPGQGLYVAPGQPHAYFRGCALELMANSDNEVRAGLTNKRRDLAEFLAILDFGDGAPPLLSAGPGGPGRASSLCAYDLDSDDFSLTAASVSGGMLRRDGRSGPEIILCVEGTVALSRGGLESQTGPESPAGEGPFVLHRGQSLFVSADEPAYDLAGRGLAYIAAAGRGRRGCA